MSNGKIIVETVLDNSRFYYQYKQLESKANDLRATLEDTTGLSKNEIADMQAELEKTENSMDNLVKKAEKEANANKKAFGIENLRSLKKFGLGLLGVSGAYSLIRKAVSATLSDNEELANRFQSIWKMLGTLLTPALDYLSNILMKALGYLNEFIKVLSGGKIDMVARANANALKKQADATKELKNQTYGFDELNIQQSNSGNSSSSGLISIPDLNQDLLGKITGIASALKKIGDWIDKYLGINGRGGVVLTGIALIIGSKAAGSGLLGIVGTLLLIYENMKLVGLIKEDVDDVKDSVDDVNRSIEKTRENTRNLSNVIDNTINNSKPEDKIETINKELQLLNTSIDGTITTTENYKNTSKNAMDIVVNSFTGVRNTARESMESSAESTNVFIEKMMELASQGNLSEEQYYLLVTSLINYRNELSKANDGSVFFKDTINDLNGKLATLGRTDVKATIGVNDNATYKINNLLNELKNISGITLNIGSSGNIYGSGNARHFATGGVIHKSALGSIVNNPGRGVYVGSGTIAGESGREGVIPLTDPNAMTELGETIGKYITVNLTNITKLDSKIINKENSTISNDMSFIRNGGV